ncbi:MAG: gliding motility-associated lipoprotein GldK, partial [Prevotella sp.]
MKKLFIILCITAATVSFVSCMSGRKMSSSVGSGGEVTGLGGRSFTEPTPYGMTKVARGYLNMG